MPESTQRFSRCRKDVWRSGKEALPVPEERVKQETDRLSANTGAFDKIAGRQKRKVMKGGKKDEFQTVGQAMRDMMNAYRLTPKYDEAQIIAAWERLVGKPIARRTRRLSIKNSVLFVEFDSPTMRRDFSLHREDILNLFKKEFGSGVITEIVAM